jgi:adenylate cyclase class IV
VVNKKRDFFLYKNTRIHLDKVDNLGEFIELETVFTKNIMENDMRKEHFFVIDFLGLNNLKTIQKSYSDFMLSLPGKQK